jgi:hypothetical protein
MFPSFQGLAPQEATRRAEALGQFSVRAWAAGPQAMQGKGIAVPPEVHGRLASAAAQVAQAGRGGLQFIAYMRQGFADDAKFAAALKGFARVYAESLRGATPAAAAPVSAAVAAPAPAVDLAPGLSVGAPLTLAGAGDLDLAPPRAAPTPAPSPTASPSAAAPAMGGLDLVDEEPSSPQVSGYDELLYSMDSDASSEEIPVGTDPAENGFRLYEQTGEQRGLDEAEAALQKQFSTAPHATAAAFAEAGLAKVALLRGDRAGAEKRANQALEAQPTNALGVEVLVRCMRGEAKEVAFRKSMHQLRSAMQSRVVDQIKGAAQTMATENRNEPFPYLAMMMVARIEDDTAGVERFLRQAWANYPSKDHADTSFGKPVDADLLDMMLAFGRTPLATMDEEGLRAAVENVDSKDNVIAGTLRMSAGLARVALTQSGLDRPMRRRLLYSIGKAMMGLQYFEEAPVVMSKALRISPTDEEMRDVGKERVKCQALWRAFDKPGIKAQKGFKCLGAHAMAQAVTAKLSELRDDKSKRQQALWDKAPGVLERALRNPEVGGEIAEAAAAAIVPNPMEQISALDRELATLVAGPSKTAAAPKAEKKGFFGKLKAAAADAASQVSSAAMGAANKIKESQLQSKRQEAIRSLVTVFARDLSDYEFSDPELLAFAKEALVHEAFMDYLATEEGRWQKRLKKLADGGPQS